MSIKPSLSKLFLLPVMIILFSLGFFSFKSEAAVVESTPVLLGYHTDTGRYDPIIFTTSISNDNLCFFFIYDRGDAQYPCVVTHSPVNFTFTYSSIFNDSNTAESYTTGFTSYTFDGSVYYYQMLTPAEQTFNYLYYGVRPNTNIIYNSISSAFTDWKASQGPDFADFGFKDFNYVTSISPNALQSFFHHNVAGLNYLVSWNGSTNAEFPITSYTYKLYGFSDLGMSNSDLSNGELLFIRENVTQTPQFGNFNIQVSDYILGSLGDLMYPKVVLYITPYSNNTEGNTHFIVCNTPIMEENLNFGPIEIPIGEVMWLEPQYGDGVLPVSPTTYVSSGNNAMEAGSIDGIPVLFAIKSTSGSFNTTNNYYNQTYSYSPVIYGDTNEINNYYENHSTVINNNQTYNNIINNINGSIDLDGASADGIISFLTALVTFFNTFWSYIIVCLNWLPSWVTVFITSIFTTTASIIVILGIFKLVR